MTKHRKNKKVAASKNKGSILDRIGQYWRTDDWRAFLAAYLKYQNDPDGKAWEPYIADARYNYLTKTLFINKNLEKAASIASKILESGDQRDIGRNRDCALVTLDCLKIDEPGFRLSDLEGSSEALPKPWLELRRRQSQEALVLNGEDPLTSKREALVLKFYKQLQSLSNAKNLSPFTKLLNLAEELQKLALSGLQNKVFNGILAMATLLKNLRRKKVNFEKQYGDLEKLKSYSEEFQTIKEAFPHAPILKVMWWRFIELGQEKFGYKWASEAKTLLLYFSNSEDYPSAKLANHLLAPKSNLNEYNENKLEDICDETGPKHCLDMVKLVLQIEKSWKWLPPEQYYLQCLKVRFFMDNCCHGQDYSFLMKEASESVLGILGLNLEICHEVANLTHELLRRLTELSANGWRDGRPAAWPRFIGQFYSIMMLLVPNVDKKYDRDRPCLEVLPEFTLVILLSNPSLRQVVRQFLNKRGYKIRFKDREEIRLSLAFFMHALCFSLEDSQNFILYHLANFKEDFEQNSLALFVESMTVLALLEASQVCPDWFQGISNTSSMRFWPLLAKSYKQFILSLCRPGCVAAALNIFLQDDPTSINVNDHQALDEFWLAMKKDENEMITSNISLTSQLAASILFLMLNNPIPYFGLMGKLAQAAAQFFTHEQLWKELTGKVVGIADRNIKIKVAEEILESIKELRMTSLSIHEVCYNLERIQKGQSVNNYFVDDISRYLYSTIGGLLEEIEIKFQED
ncbi:MAG: hypothetical protein LBV23_02495 [Deltaproteobacteria bacterium]|jgi:hypothetical protein|nr:hypothetical protein [Deltaproteobacteria bacterium]